VSVPVSVSVGSVRVSDCVCREERLRDLEERLSD